MSSAAKTDTSTSARSPVSAPPRCPARIARYSEQEGAGSMLSCGSPGRRAPARAEDHRDRRRPAEVDHLGLPPGLGYACPLVLAVQHAHRRSISWCSVTSIVIDGRSNTCWRSMLVSSGIGQVMPTAPAPLRSCRSLSTAPGYRKKHYALATRPRSAVPRPPQAGGKCRRRSAHHCSSS